MRVLFNGLTALKPRTGIGQYAARLAAEMTSLLGDDFSVYPPEPWKNLVATLLNRKSGSPPGGSRSRRGTLAGFLKRGGRMAAGLHFVRYCRTYGVKLYHEPNYLPFNASVPTVVTVHDLSVLLHPEWHPADRVREHVQRLERAVAGAAHVITDTEQVRREVIAELRLGEDKVTAIHLGVGEEFQPVDASELAIWRRRLNLPQEYFLCVGTIEPRKNLLTAMKAFAALPPQLRERSPLLLAGPWGWRAEAEFDYFNRVGQAAGIRHLGYVFDDAMPALYSGATATLYPSLYEGFGLPPLEAVACGSSAICSPGTAAVCEVMGSKATYCDATDIEAWRDAMRQKIEERHVANLQSPASRFTWRRTAEQTIKVYDGVLRGTSSLQRAA